MFSSAKAFCEEWKNGDVYLLLIVSPLQCMGSFILRNTCINCPYFFNWQRHTTAHSWGWAIVCLFASYKSDHWVALYAIILSNFFSYLQKIDCKVLTSALYLQGIQGTCVAIGSELWDPLHSLVTILLRGLSEHITPFAAHPRKLDEVEPTKRNRHMHCHDICCNTVEPLYNTVHYRRY